MLAKYQFYTIFSVFCILSRLQIYAQNGELEQRLKKSTEAEQVFIYDEYAQKYRENQPKKSLEYAEKGLQLAHKVKDTTSVAYLYTFIGVLYKNMGNYEKALEFYQKAIPINTQIKNKQGNAGIYNNIAFVYRLQGRYKNSLEYYLKSLQFFQEAKSQKQVSNVLNNIGSLYSDQKNYEKALDYFYQSLIIAQKLPDTLGIAFAYNNMGEVYQKQGKWKEAKINFVQSLVWKKKKKHLRSIASGYANLGLVFQEESKLDSAKYFLEEASKIYKQIDDTNGFIETLLRLGEMQTKQEEYQLASQYYQEALNQSLKIGSKPLTEKAYKFFSEYYAQKQDYTNAYKYRVLYDNTKDSLMNIESVKQINELQAKYDDEAQKKQISLLQLEKRMYGLERDADKKNKMVLDSRDIDVVFVGYGSFMGIQNEAKKSATTSKAK